MQDKGQGGVVARLEEFSELLFNPFYWLDLKQNYLGVNTATLEVTSTKSFEKDFYGKTPFDLYPKKMAEEIIAHHLEVVRTGKIICTEESIKDIKAKKTKFFIATIAPLIDDQKNIIGTYGISTEITKEKNLTEALRIANASKSEFIENMSHDIRTPITGIVGMLRDLLYTVSDIKKELKADNAVSVDQLMQCLQSFLNRVKDNTNIIWASIDELLNLCNEILEVARLEAGKAETATEAFDLTALIRHNVQLLQPKAIHKKLELTTYIDEDLPRYFKGFYKYLDRTILNLLSNGLKFTDKGSVGIVVDFLGNRHLSHKKGDPVRVQIYVKDTGIGIPEEKFDTIFEHFSRLTPSSQGIYEGSGLGLFTVKCYVEAMEGTIHVESKVDEGTCFILNIPLVLDDHADRKHESVCEKLPGIDSDDDVPVAPTQIIPSRNPQAPAEGKAQVLLVEDQRIAAMAVENILSRVECVVDVAATGTEAVEKASHNTYDLIFMDMGLPDFTGIEATKRIRVLLDPKKSTVPIIALTGHAGGERRQACLDAGINDVLVKPAKVMVLEAVIKSWVWDRQKSVEQSKAGSLGKDEIEFEALSAID